MRTKRDTYNAYPDAIPIAQNVILDGSQLNQNERENIPMARTPSMTVTEAEGYLGPRGELIATPLNRGNIRKWLSANGVSSAAAAELTLRDLQDTYNDTTDYKLTILQGRSPSDNPAPTLSTLPAAPQNAPTASVGLPAGLSPDKLGQLFTLLQSMGGGIDRNTVESIVQEQLSQFRDLLPDFVAACSPVTRIEIQRPDATLYRVEGIVHPQFQKLLKLATSRDADGRVPGIFIAGEASSGKTTGSKMLAKALGLKWYFNGAISMDHQMLGFIDAAGNYHRTPFRDAYEYGGVFTFDENDRCDANALLGVNPHLAGDLGSFPDGIIERHKDFILTATANTWGLGGSSDYAGATKLDAAYLSRFPSRLHWDIDEAFEIQISGNETWARRVQGARRRAREAGLKIMICSRMTIAGAAHIANGMTSDEAAQATYLANLKPEQRAIVEAH